MAVRWMVSESNVTLGFHNGSLRQGQFPGRQTARLRPGYRMESPH